MRKLITNSFTETQQLGEDFAKQLRGGEVLCLYGDLGSGKTTFVQGLAKGLGVTGKIISPTFIIMRQYVIPDLIQNPELDARLHGHDNGLFYHIDLYRIGSEREIEELGLLELLNDPETIVVIEWPEKMENLLPKKRIDIFFEYVKDDKREIKIIADRIELDRLNLNLFCRDKL